jgi:putative sigma-54 modulation protein
MQIHISPRDIKLTPAIHAYIAQKVGHLEHYAGEIIGAHIAIWHDQDKANKHAFNVKIHLAIPGPDIHAEDHGHELYSAIDIVCDRLAEQLRHRKSRKKSRTLRNARKTKEAIRKNGTLTTAR